MVASCLCFMSAFCSFYSPVSDQVLWLLPTGRCIVMVKPFLVHWSYLWPSRSKKNSTNFWLLWLSEFASCCCDLTFPKVPASSCLFSLFSFPERAHSVPCFAIFHVSVFLGPLFLNPDLYFKLPTRIPTWMSSRYVTHKAKFIILFLHVPFPCYVFLASNIYIQPIAQKPGVILKFYPFPIPHIRLTVLYLSYPKLSAFCHCCDSFSSIHHISNSSNPVCTP